MEMPSASVPTAGGARAAALTLAFALGALAAVVPADASASLPAVPSQLAPAANEALAMIVPAKGVQIYECRPSKDGARYEWAFVAPEAELFDQHGKGIGSHGAGPHWQSSDGSRIMGKVTQRADAPVPGAIPWLLLATESAGAQGAFSRVSSIQRVNTVGGVAPAAGCSRETAGRSARIGYSADYYFFVPRADTVSDWNVKAGQIVVESKMGTPPAIRVMAVVQTAVYDAVNAITRRYPAPTAQPKPAPGASIDAAVAAANRTTLAKLIPAQQAAIDSAYQAALAAIPEGPAKAAGIAVGEKAATAVLAARADDTVAPTESYRPHTTPGAYVPTAMPAAPQWVQRKPWLMASAAQFRPGPPPALASELWARDYNEVKALGAKQSALRTAEQTEIARFWEYSLPPIYLGVVRSVTDSPGREATQNARLFAAVAQAMDDAMIAVFEAKYHYNFWRPATAIRNGDIDGNDATAREASWTPFVEAPLHPEYPSAHSILAGAVGTVLKAELAGGPMPVLATASPTAKGITRRWTDIDAFVREVADARVYEGIHYRRSTEVGAAMGKEIGELALKRYALIPE